MKIPTVHGLIDRRILINFTVDPVIVSKIVPAPFRPKVHKNKAIVGICLIRFKKLRPKGFPEFIGISSENGAHRIAVEWDEESEIKEGVYIPRRDTSLRLNTLLGGRIFPGKHYLAKFNVEELEGNYHVDFTSSDQTSISIDAKETTLYNQDSVLRTLMRFQRFLKKVVSGILQIKIPMKGLSFVHTIGK